MMSLRIVSLRRCSSQLFCCCFSCYHDLDMTKTNSNSQLLCFVSPWNFFHNNDHLKMFAFISIIKLQQLWMLNQICSRLTSSSSHSIEIYDETSIAEVDVGNHSNEEVSPFSYYPTNNALRHLQYNKAQAGKVLLDVFLVNGIILCSFQGTCHLNGNVKWSSELEMNIIFCD